MWFRTKWANFFYKNQLQLCCGTRDVKFSTLRRPRVRSSHQITVIRYSCLKIDFFYANWVWIASDLCCAFIYGHFKRVNRISSVCNAGANAPLSISSVCFVGQKSLWHQSCCGSKSGTTKVSRTLLMAVIWRRPRPPIEKRKQNEKWFESFTMVAAMTIRLTAVIAPAIGLYVGTVMWIALKIIVIEQQLKRMNLLKR